MSVADPSPLPAYEQVKAFIKTKITQGLWRPGDAVPSESALQQQFGVSRMIRVGAKVFHSTLVHFENGVPILFEDRHVNPHAAPDYLAVDFEKTTPTHYLLKHAPLTEASYSIEACLPSALETQWLDIAASEPCLVMTRCTTSGPHVASLARLVYPGLRYSFSGNFQL